MVYHGLIMVYHHRTIYHFVPINVRIWGYAPFSGFHFWRIQSHPGLG
jgi:hypothetical protein